MRILAVAGMTAVPLSACQIVGGADYLDTRDNSTVVAVWNTRATDFFSECSSELQPIDAPPREVLLGIALKGPMSQRNYNHADFYVCPELAEVSQ